MAFHTQQSISGFVATSPQLSSTNNGDARFFARIGQEHFQRNDDGSFTDLEPTFHTLILYRRTAERAYEQFRKGDKFVAEGYVREYEYKIDGESRQAEQFIAKKIGHDTARTTYAVDRTPAPTGELTRSVNATGLDTNPAHTQESESVTNTAPAEVSAHEAPPAGNASTPTATTSHAPLAPYPTQPPRHSATPPGPSMSL